MFLNLLKREHTCNEVYYRVKPEYDKMPRIDGSVLFADELYTEKEMSAFQIPNYCVEPVTIYKKKHGFFKTTLYEKL